MMLVRDDIIPILRQYSLPDGVLAEYDFSGGVVGGVQVLNPVAGAVARDSLQTVGSGQQRRSGLGLLVEKTSTNKCTNTNLKPTDTSGTTPGGAFTVHERVARGSLPADLQNQLGRADPQGNVTAMYRSRSTTGDSITVAGTTGNTNAHSASGWHYTVTGDWGFGVDTPSVRFIQGSLIRTAKENVTPAGASSQLVAGCTQASEAYWIGNQLEEKPERSSVIEVSGTTVTRLGDLVRAAMPSGFNAQAFTITDEFNKFGTPSVPDRVIFLSRVGGNLQDQIVNSTLISRLTDGSATISGPAYTLGTDRLRAWGSEGTTLSSATDGVEDGTAVWTPPAGYDFIYFGADADGTRQVDGYIKRVVIFDRSAAVGSGFSTGFNNGFS